MLTLRQVEEATGVSNAYLSQLENNKISKPSANVLYKLSQMYKVDLDIFLAAAGIIKKEDSIIHKLKVGAFVITADEEQELIKYLQFLRRGKSKQTQNPI